ncbi:glycosyltransferase family 1 protein [Candidatus Bathyarchaeota archaeon]|nr:MAG: glycosyltransferase family 1 protein [Candidatus Bathyarchaeota archaeon]
MRICMLTWEFPPRIVGGIARHCLSLSKALAKLGHEVYVVTLEFPGAPLFEDINGIKVYRVLIELGHPNFIIWTFIFNHFMEKKVADLSENIEFDIIHIHDWLTAKAGISSKHFLNKPLISTIHSTEEGRSRGLHNPDSFLIDGIEWWMTYEARRVIVCSNSVKWEVESHFSLPHDKVTVIPNGIEVSSFNLNINREEVKRRYGIKPNERIILFVGRLVPQKGVDMLIKAAPLIVQQHRDARILIAGDGWSRNYLEELARSMGLRDRIRFLGFISDWELEDLMVTADVLVVPSIYEPFGIVALEGMAAGTPVVATNIGGLSEIIEHDRTGVLVYPEDPGSIAWGINKVLSDPKYADWLARNARRKVRKAYSWEAIAKRTVEVYEAAI